MNRGGYPGVAEDGSQYAPDDKDSEAKLHERIAAQRTELEENYSNLDNVAKYCENNYYNTQDKSKALEETKQYALQSMASDLLTMLNVQAEKINDLTFTVCHAALSLDLKKEKQARRDIGNLTTNKNVPVGKKIIMPDELPETSGRYKRTPIDYSIYDGVGHGTRAEQGPILRGTVSRATSSASGGGGGSHYGTYSSHYSSPLNNMNTLTRAHQRAAAIGSVQVEHGYRVPQTVPVVDSRMSTMRADSTYGVYNAQPGTPSSTGSGGAYNDNRYGTLRIHRQDSGHSGSGGGGSLLMGGAYENGSRTPTLHRLSPIVQQGQTATGYAGGYNDLPLPPPELLSTGLGSNSRVSSATGSSLGYRGRAEVEDDLPPPPSATTHAPLSHSLFDTHADWIPDNYLEKAIALYDYEAQKPDELTLIANCTVYVVRKNEDGWYEGVLDGVTGLFPGNYVITD